MLPLVSDAAKISEQIHAGVQKTIESVCSEDINQEPHITDRLLARLEDAIDSTKDLQIGWRARTLTDHGRSAEESRVGADFAGTFEATTKDLTFSKSFLAQAKILNEDAKLSKKEASRLRLQCRKMLQVTPASFVFLYGKTSISVVSALAVFSTPTQNLNLLGAKDVPAFFHDHLTCFIGDTTLSYPWLPKNPRQHLQFSNTNTMWFGLRKIFHIEASEALK